MKDKKRPNSLYCPHIWDKESKVIHRTWIADTIEKNQRSIMQDGKLKPEFSIVTLAGFNFIELEWFLKNRNFFSPEQYLAIDMLKFNTDRARELGLPQENIRIGILEHELRSLRESHNIAVINADATTTMSNCISDINSLIKSAQNCCEKTGECFLFVTSIAEILNCKKISKNSEDAYRFISKDLFNMFFHDQKRNPILREFLLYRGNHIDTLMMCFCIHLIK